MTIEEVNALVGRVVSKGGMTFTVQSASTYGKVCVWDPQTRTMTCFDNRETFENWAYGTPVPAARGPQ